MPCKFEKVGTETYIKFSGLESLDFMKHCITTRQGGFSGGGFSGLNMGLFTDDSREAVGRNHMRVAETLGYELKNAVFTNQIHEDRIGVVDKSFKGEKFWLGERALDTDALITNLPGRPLIAFFADCAGVFIADPVRRAVGVAHAGWRGTIGEIGKKTLRAMGTRYGTKPSDCVVAIGPSIGPCCFEVGGDVAGLFVQAYGESVAERSGDEGKWKVDLWEANRLQMKEAGVREENIEVAGLCTVCREDLLFSHRRDKGITGRMAGVVEIR